MSTVRSGKSARVGSPGGGGTSAGVQSVPSVEYQTPLLEPTATYPGPPAAASTTIAPPASGSPAQLSATRCQTRPFSDVNAPSSEEVIRKPRSVATTLTYSSEGVMFASDQSRPSVEKRT